MELLAKAIKDGNHIVIEFLKKEGIKADANLLEVAISVGNVQSFEAMYYNEFEIKPCHFEMTTSVDMLKLLAKLKFKQREASIDMPPPIYVGIEFNESKYDQFMKHIHIGIIITDDEFTEMFTHMHAKKMHAELIFDIIRVVPDNNFNREYERICRLAETLKFQPILIGSLLAICVKHNREKIFDAIYFKHRLDILRKNVADYTYDEYMRKCVDYSLIYRNRSMYDKIVSCYYDITKYNAEYLAKLYVGAGFQDLLEPILKHDNNLMNIALHAHQFDMVKYLISRGFDIKQADSSYMILDPDVDFVIKCLSDDKINEIDMTNAAMICGALDNTTLVKYIMIHAKNGNFDKIVCGNLHIIENAIANGRVTQCGELYMYTIKSTSVFPHMGLLNPFIIGPWYKAHGFNIY